MSYNDHIFNFFFQACAPRYVFHQMHPRKVERVEPVGTCFIARNQLTEFTEYSPCRTSKSRLITFFSIRILNITTKYS